MTFPALSLLHTLKMLALSCGPLMMTISKAARGYSKGLGTGFHLRTSLLCQRIISTFGLPASGGQEPRLGRGSQFYHYSISAKTCKAYTGARDIGLRTYNLSSYSACTD